MFRDFFNSSSEAGVQLRQGFNSQVKQTRTTDEVVHLPLKMG
jgi:hypothetical protein